MKNKHFIFIFIGIIALIILTFALQATFYEYTNKFELSCGMFFLLIFCLFCYKNALKPTETFGPKNLTKKFYERKGDLPKYQNLCKILFMITIGAGIMTLLGGFGEIVVANLKSLFAK